MRIGGRAVSLLVMVLAFLGWDFDEFAPNSGHAAPNPGLKSQEKLARLVPERQMAASRLHALMMVAAGVEVKPAAFSHLIWDNRLGHVPGNDRPGV
jgi:hypothetical protein